MDNGIALIAIVVAAVVGSTIVWLALRRNLPPELSLALAAYVAAIRAAVGDVVDDELVATLAGYAWDSWASASKYISRDEFIRYVLDALAMEPFKAAELTHQMSVQATG
jgi:hypothetical protein